MREVEEGSVYLNHGRYLARCVWAEGGRVRYFDFTYPDCQLLSPMAICGRGAFQRWTHFVLSPDEVAAMQVPLPVLRSQAADEFDRRTEETVQRILTSASREQLEEALAKRKLAKPKRDGNDYQRVIDLSKDLEDL